MRGVQQGILNPALAAGCSRVIVKVPKDLILDSMLSQDASLPQEDCLSVPVVMPKSESDRRPNRVPYFGPTQPEGCVQH